MPLRTYIDNEDHTGYFELEETTEGSLQINYEDGIAKYSRLENLVNTQSYSGEHWLLWPEDGWENPDITEEVDLTYVAISWIDESHNSYWDYGDGVGYEWYDHLDNYDSFVNSFEEGQFKYVFFDVERDTEHDVKSSSVPWPQYVYPKEVSRSPTKEDFIEHYESVVGDNKVGVLVTTIDVSGSMTQSTIEPAYSEFLDWLSYGANLAGAYKISSYSQTIGYQGKFYSYS